jgi:hypothetical protein
LIAIIRTCSLRLAGFAHLQFWAVGASRNLQVYMATVLPAMFLAESTREHFYNILWVLVFAFATLNILGLGIRRLDRRGGLSFGEVVAIMVIVFSMIMLGWELLYELHVLPIRLEPE